MITYKILDTRLLCLIKVYKYIIQKIYLTDHLEIVHTPLQICFIWMEGHNLQKVKNCVGLLIRWKVGYQKEKFGCFKSLSEAVGFYACRC